MDTPFQACGLSSDMLLSYNPNDICSENTDLYISLSIHSYEPNSYKPGTKNGSFPEIQPDSLHDRIMYILPYHAQHKIF